ncbi:MAG: hypothetical protein MUF61_01600 [archaeon]|jgi:hypothetical protein|nr:hypothetical protein [archaeon]
MTGRVVNGKYLSEDDVRREDDKFNAERARLGEIDAGRECVWHTSKILREMFETLEKRGDAEKACVCCYGFDFKCEYYRPRGEKQNG